MQDSYQPQELVDFPGGEAQFLGLVLRPLPLGYIDSLHHLDLFLLFENLDGIRKYVGKSVIFC